MTCRAKNLNTSVFKDADSWAYRSHNPPGTGCTFGEQVPRNVPLNDTALGLAGFVGGVTLMLTVYVVAHFFRDEIRRALSK